MEAFQRSDALGRFILLLLFCMSFYSWFILVYEFLNLRRSAANTERFLAAFELERADPLAFQRSRASLAATCPLDQVFRVGCRRLSRMLAEEGALGHRELAELEESMKLALSTEGLRMQSRLVTLATISSVAPLLGLFGTVWGIMLSFHSMAASGVNSLKAVAPGITIALVTTVAGLAVAIPALVGHNLLAAGIRRTIASMKSFILDFIALLEERYVREGGKSGGADCNRARRTSR